jgi:lysophospholipase L1-like esterase
MAGTDDVPENQGAESDEGIEGALRSMVELASSHQIKVVLASIPPAAEFPGHPPLQPVGRLRQLNRWIKAYAAQADVQYVDYWPALATDSGAMKPELSADGIHPNSQGYKVMQPLAEAAIAHALGAP